MSKKKLNWLILTQHACSIAIAFFVIVDGRGWLSRQTNWLSDNSLTMEGFQAKYSAAKSSREPWLDTLVTYAKKQNSLMAEASTTAFSITEVAMCGIIFFNILSILCIYLRDRISRSQST